jgi:hypothetical protein
MVYRMDLAEGGKAELTVRRIEPRPGLDAGQVCEQLIGPHRSLFTILLSTPVPKRQEALGPWKAIEAAAPEVPMMARATVLPDGEAYAVTLRVTDGVIDERLYRAFDATCRSVLSMADHGRRFLQQAP